MKRIISVLILVCLMAGMFTLSAWADGDTTVSLTAFEFTFDSTKDNREAISISFSTNNDITANEKIAVNLLNGTELVGCTTYKLSYPCTLSAGVNGGITANAVLAGKASGSWETVWFKKITAEEETWPDKVVLYIDDNEYPIAISQYRGTEWISSFTQFNETTANPEPSYEFPWFSHYNIQTLPEGVMPGGEDYRERITFYIQNYTNPIPDFKAVIYSGDTVIAETTQKGGTLTDKAKTFNIVLYGDPSNSWDTTVKNVGPGLYPDKVEFYSGTKLIFTHKLETTDEMKQVFDNFECVKNAKLNPAPVAPAPVSNPYSVPATADNSNMPLWGALLIGFAAVALLTGKKRKA